MPARTTSAVVPSTAYDVIDLLPGGPPQGPLRDELARGLTAPAKRTTPTWLYDAVGSDLFERITTLPEYYPTRCEREILSAHAADAVALADCTDVVELGSGSSLKTELLLDALTTLTATRRSAAGPVGYVALDVSDDALRDACERTALTYPQVRVHAVRTDFTTQLGAALEAVPATGPRLVAFLGGTIGNFEPAARGRFLAGLRRALRPGDHLLLGADLVKSPAVLLPAYDDAAGVTTAFDLNLLTVLNRAFDGDFDPARFRHRAVWDTEREWIEMRLRSEVAQTVTLRTLHLQVAFAAGEELRTEVSAKFRRTGLTAELDVAGFGARRWWTDPAGLFSLSLWQARPLSHSSV
jgi:L-histidine N-alpha-methyltransferase